MAGNLPIQFNITTPKTQPKLPVLKMPNVTLPPMKLPATPKQQPSIFTPKPIIDLTKKPEDSILSPIFGQKNVTQPPIAITPKRVITDEELEKEKKEIKVMLQSRKDEDAIENILDSITKDNIELAKLLCKDEKFNNDDYIWKIKYILEVTNADNIELAKILCNDEKFTNKDNISRIQDILAKTNADNIELAKILCKDEKFTNYLNISRISNILYETNADNIELAKIICQDEKFNNADEHFLTRIEDILKETNADNIELAKIICKDKKFTTWYNIDEIQKILSKTNADNVELAIIISQDEKFNNGDYVQLIEYIISETDAQNKDFVKKVVQNKFIPVSMMSYVINHAYYFEKYINTDIFEKIDNYKHTMLQNPELYINGEVSNPKQEIKNFFEEENNYTLLTKAFDIFDKESIDNLMRRRLDNVKTYLRTLMFLKPEQLQLLKKMVACNNMSDKPLLSAQKVEFIDLLQSFKDNDVPLSIIEESIVDNKIDLGKIKLDLFKTILKNCGMNEEQIESIPKEKILSWDLDYMHRLTKSINKDKTAFIDLLNGANSDDFIKYIHDKDNVYGKANEKTINQFKELNMNYEKWLHPDKNLETKFVAIDKNSELLFQLATSISDDIKELRTNSAVKKFFDKQFEKYIEKDEFIIPQEIAGSKANLIVLINNIIEQLKPVWERAENNKDNPQKQEAARKTLTLLSHLQTKLESLQKMNDTKTEKPFDVTIKMWDRIPQKDLFQGNFSTCCIGMGYANSKAMPHYLMNTAFNMIELVDNNTGKTIGNALCYFVKDENNEPIFVIDNIEINNSQKPSEKTSILLREQMFAYAKNVAKSITGKDTKVTMSDKYNDVDLKGLSSETKSLKLIGNVDSDEIYMDLFDGWTDEWSKFKEVKCYGE